MYPFKLFVLFTATLFFTSCVDSPVSGDNDPIPADPTFTDGGGDVPGGTSDNPSGTTQNITSEDIALSETQFQMATAQLESVLSADILNADLSEANLAYKSAIEANPNNTKAQFGAATTELMMINQNETFQQFADELSVSEGGLFKSRTIPLKLNSAKIRNVDGVVPMLASAQAGELPKISELQDVVRDEMLPRMVYALDRLSIIQNDPAFTFNITPQMLGETEGDTYILDLGEIYVIDAGLRIMRGIMLTLISYNIDIDDNGSYEWLSSGNDSIAFVNLKRLHQSNTFLTLHDHGAGSMNSAILNLRQSVTKLQNAADFISKRTGDQMFNVIKSEYIDDIEYELDGFNGMNAYTVDQMLDEVSEYLSGPYTVDVMDDISMRINVSAIFENPIGDLKTKFPYMKWRNPSDWYTIETDEWGYEYERYEPIDFTDKQGKIIDEEEFPYFPDYTLGGLYPDMTRAKWIDYIDQINDLMYTDPIATDNNYSLSKMSLPFGKALR